VPFFTLYCTADIGSPGPRVTPWDDAQATKRGRGDSALSQRSLRTSGEKDAFYYRLRLYPTLPGSLGPGPRLDRCDWRGFSAVLPLRPELDFQP